MVDMRKHAQESVYTMHPKCLQIGSVGSVTSIDEVHMIDIEQKQRDIRKSTGTLLSSLCVVDDPLFSCIPRPYSFLLEDPFAVDDVMQSIVAYAIHCSRTGEVQPARET